MKVQVHKSRIVYMMSPMGEVGRRSARAAGKVRGRAKRGSTVDSGVMKNSIKSELAVQGQTTVRWRIGSNVKYTKWQELGTGPILARRAPLLVFKIGNRWVSTYSTKGVPAARMLTKAIEKASVRDFL